MNEHGKIFRRRLTSGCCGAGIILALAAASPALAQTEGVDTASTADTGVIIVTATRRETQLQNTPLAISALNAASLQNNNITDLTKLPLQVPSLYIGGNDGFGGVTVALRGIGSLNLGVGAEEGVGIYIDGVYQGKPYGSLFSFVDIERVEVLRGPQGTLYGRNATGGAINIVTKLPGREFTGQVNAEYTNYNGIRVSGYVMAPLSEQLSVKIAGGSDTRDGWAYNPTRDENPYKVNNKYVSGTLRWQPSSSTDVVLSGRAGLSYNYQQQKDVNDASLPTKIFPADAPGHTKNRFASGSLSITQDFDAMSVVSITGYGTSKAEAAQDSDLLSIPLIYGVSYQKSDQFTQELRLVSKNDGPFTWLIGGLYYHEKSRVNLPFVLPVAPPFVNSILFYGGLKVDSYSIYAEGTYKLTDALSFTAGGRYSYDEKDWQGCVGPSSATGLPPFSTCDASNTNADRQTFRAFTPHFVVDYKVSDDVMLYASATRGFRSGGWNFTDATFRGSGFRPENIWSYEGGTKTRLFDRHLQLNLAGYYSDYNKLQIRVPDGPFLAVRNAGAARIYGFELESSLNLDKFNLSVNGSYLNAKYTSFPAVVNGVATNYAGQTLNRSPKWNASVSGQYELSLGDLGSLTPRAEYHYTSTTYYSVENILPLGASSVDVVNLRLKYQPVSERWNVTAYVDNLTNDQHLTYAIPGNLPGQVAGIYSDPRIYGVRAQFNW